MREKKSLKRSLHEGRDERSDVRRGGEMAKNGGCPLAMFAAWQDREKKGSQLRRIWPARAECARAIN